MMKMRSPSFSRCSFIFKVILGVAWIALATGCATTRASAEAASFEADGIYVCHMRLRIAPSHTRAFEAMLKRCAEAAVVAETNGTSNHWLCYREPPGRYWILFFGDTIDGFQYPCDLKGFARSVARTESATAEGEIIGMLDELEFETEWEIVSRQKTEWSTVGGMSTVTHPKARLMVRTIRPGKEAAFDAALTARTAFLAEHGYPLPIEGFAIRTGAPGRSWQVVFPVDWPSFHETDSFYAFVRSLDQASQDEYAGLKAALMETMASAEYYDATFAPELRYRPE